MSRCSRGARAGPASASAGGRTRRRGGAGMPGAQRGRSARGIRRPATAGEDGAAAEGPVGFQPGKEMGGWTGGWMGGELGLKTEEGLEKAMSETMKNVQATPPEQLETTKTKYKNIEKAQAEAKVGRAVEALPVGKDFGGMAGGWPLGEVGLKTQEGLDFVNSGKTKKYGEAGDENNLGVYLPLAVVSTVVTAAFMAFFFQIDVGAAYDALMQTVSGSGSAGGEGGAAPGAGASVLRAAVAQSSDSRTLVLGGGALAGVLATQLAASAISNSLASLRAKAGDNAKIGALVVAGMAVAYKILSE